MHESAGGFVLAAGLLTVAVAFWLWILRRLTRELARLAADGVAPDTLLRVPHMFSHFHSADADTS